MLSGFLSCRVPGKKTEKKYLKVGLQIVRIKSPNSNWFSVICVCTYVHIHDPCMWVHVESTGQPLDVLLRKSKHLYWGRANPWPGVHELDCSEHPMDPLVCGPWHYKHAYCVWHFSGFLGFKHRSACLQAINFIKWTMFPVLYWLNAHNFTTFLLIVTSHLP